MAALEKYGENYIVQYLKRPVLGTPSPNIVDKVS
jgi:hypothetical protein